MTLFIVSSLLNYDGVPPPDVVSFALLFYALLVFLGFVALGVFCFRFCCSLVGDDYEPITIKQVGGLLWKKSAIWRREALWLKEMPVSWSLIMRLVFVLMALQFASLLLIKGAATAGFVSKDNVDSIWIILQGLVFHLACIVVIFVILKKHGLSWFATFGLSREVLPYGIKKGIVFFLATMPVLVTTAFFYHMTLESFGVKLSVQDAISLFLSPPSPYMLPFYAFVIVVVAPVAEELLFRGILLPLFARHFGPVAAIFGTSVLFAFAHFHVPSIMPLFVLATAFSIAYINTRNIIVPIVMHAVFNGINIGMVLMLSDKLLCP